MGAGNEDRGLADAARPIGCDTATTSLLPDEPRPAVARRAKEATGRVEVGDRIGRYALTSELGKGGMGRVFVAHDAGLDRLAAIKFISVINSEMVKRFVAEARATARCIHPNIVSVYEIGEHLGAPYLVLEHLDGPSLAQLVRGERLPIPRVIAIMTAVARALACAHSHGIVHRDLKPSNIVVLAGDVAKVLDFGIASFAQRGIAADDDDDETRRQTGEIAGTLPYMAPEQLRGAPADGRVDVWAFGVVLHQLLAGERPFDHLSEPELRAEVLDLDRPTPAITRHRSDLPPALVEVVTRCLAKSRAQRFQTADQLLEAMQRLAAPPPRRHGRGAIVMIAVLVIAAGIAWRWSRDTRTTATAAVLRGQVAQLERLEDQMERLQSAGDRAGADALFDGFAAQPENLPLRSEAWRRRSGRELAAHELEPALTSGGRAYLAASDERAAARALAAVVEVQLVRRRWDEVGRALDGLGAPGDEVRRFAEAALAVATRRVGSRDALPSASLAAAAALLVGTPAPEVRGLAEVVDLDGDGRDEVVTVQDRVLRALRPGGVTLWEQPMLASPSPPQARDVATCASRDVGGAWFAVVSGDSSRLYRLDLHGATLAYQARGAHRCALGDLDGDGTSELYLAWRRELSSHRAGADAVWRSTSLDLGSQVNALVAADLDGDGRDELAVAVAEWRAFEVRVLAGADLTLIDRVRLGRVTSLVALSRGPGRPTTLLASKDQSWPSARFLPSAHPTGAPDGFYALRLHDGHLQVTGRLADEVMSPDTGTLRAADLDGDGRDEGLVNHASARPGGERTVVLHLDDHDRMEPATIEGISVLVAGRFTAGPADAALAAVADGAQGSRWWLGVGDTPVPPRAEPAPVHETPVPARLAPDLATTWRRAATLARAGATASALAAFEHLAAVAPAEHQAAALAAVLDLRLRRGDPLATVYEALAASAAPGSTDQLAALIGAMTAAVDDGEFAAAVRVIDAALSSPALSADDRVRLQATRDRVSPIATTLFDGATLDETWEVLDPVGVRRDPVTRALVLDGFGAGPLVGMELVRTRGPIQLSIEATIERAEWGAGITFALQPTSAEARPLHIGFRTIGGGGAYLIDAEGTYGVMAEWPHRGVDRLVPVRVQGTWFPDTGRVIWDLTVDGVQVHRTESRAAISAAVASTWRLEIKSDFSPGDPSATRMAMTISRIRVAGLEAAPPRSPTALGAARRALANGDHERARTLLPRQDHADVALAAAVRALRAGEPAVAIAALARVRGRGPLTFAPLRALAHLTRVDDGAHAAAVRTAVGGDWVTVTSSAWTTAAWQHPDAEAVQRELTQNLQGLELPRRGDSPMLLLRARAHAAIGDLDKAESDLDALLAPAGLAAVTPEAQADAYLERARVALRRGADDPARRAILAALDISPWPVAVADAVLLDPALAALAARPGLEPIHALGRPLAWPR